MTDSNKVRLIREALEQPFRDSNLTAKEREAANLAALGLTNPEIADRLGLSLPAVNSRIYFSRLKLRVTKSGLTRILTKEIERIVKS